VGYNTRGTTVHPCVRYFSLPPSNLDFRSGFFGIVVGFSFVGIHYFAIGGGESLLCLYYLNLEFSFDVSHDKQQAST
jgi:hypothetical protein